MGVRITVKETVNHGRSRWRAERVNGAFRERRFFGRKSDADAQAAEWLAEREMAGSVWSEMSAVDRAEVISVWHEMLAEGVRLRSVWEDWKSGKARGAGSRVRRTLAQAVVEVVVSKRAGGRRDRYVDELESYLVRFIRGRESLDCAAIAPADIEAWLARGDLAQSTRAAELGRLSALFSFCERRKYRPDNPVEQVDKPVVEVKPPRILTVEEAGRIVELCPAALQGWLLLALFAGIRPEELDRIQWESVDLEASVVTVDATASKVRARRLVHLRPGVAARLAAARAAGAVLPLVPVTRRRLMRKLRDAMGWEEWPQDVLRHTAASYWLAVEPDVPRLALELGNSPAMIFRHYRELVRREDAERFWGLVSAIPGAPCSPASRRSGD